MSIDKLIKEGSIRPFNAAQDEVNRAIEIARRDLALSERLLEENLDWCFSIAYNAVLQACRAYIFRCDIDLPAPKPTRLLSNSCSSLWRNLLENPFLTLTGSGRSGIVLYMMKWG